MLGVRLRRLRQPKYLIGACVGVAYFWFFFLRPTTRAATGNPVQALTLAFGDGRAELLAAAGLSLFVLMIWLVPGNQPGLAFSEAEVAFLFPAPLTRRQLIHYKLLDGLVGLVADISLKDATAGSRPPPFLMLEFFTETDANLRALAENFMRTLRLGGLSEADLSFSHEVRGPTPRS